ncbi:MAG: DUF4349 domain-containing protein [Propionibacteriales bacterium]|nr:DUF4349 domain-containing protein [Propionibacteriales bacterium]
MQRIRPRTLHHCLTAVALAALVGLTGCTGGSGGSDDAAAGGAQTMERDEAASSTGAREQAGAPGGGAGFLPARAARRIGEPDLIQRATVHLRHDDVGRAVEEVRRLVLDAGGLVGSESTRAGDEGRNVRTSLTLRVPAEAFADVLQEVSGIGELVSRQRSTQDVTAQVIDVESRIASQKVSVNRIRELLSRAGDLDEVLALERELASRESDLESLLAQQDRLADQTSMSTLDLTIGRTSKDEPEPDEAGFGAGLSWGWGAFVGVLTALVTAVGAALPFLLVLVPAGGLAWVAVRRTGRRSQAPPTPPPSTATG